MSVLDQITSRPAHCYGYDEFLDGYRNGGSEKDDFDGGRSHCK